VPVDLLEEQSRRREGAREACSRGEVAGQAADGCCCWCRIMFSRTSRTASSRVPAPAPAPTFRDQAACAASVRAFLMHCASSSTTLRAQRIEWASEGKTGVVSAV
jgi:hypothetical protein